jgi:8-oxo-dGTP pyrophosphatase MutT (NUDIX family)
MSNTPAPTIPSATIVLLREKQNTDANAASNQGQDMEMFMVVRHHQIDFASGALVFPGGKADPGDYDDVLLNHLDGAAKDPDMRAMQVAAIREAYEECGVLLARPQGGSALIAGERLAMLEPFRKRLNSGEVSIAEFVSQQKLQLACDRLEHFAHWITPEMMPKRFDTHFFLATAPADHLAIHDGYESVDSVWITPKQAIADAKEGSRTVIFPTLRNIEKVAQYDNIRSLTVATKAQPVVPVLPWTEKREDGVWLCINPEAGYLLNEEKMPERG